MEMGAAPFITNPSVPISNIWSTYHCNLMLCCPSGLTSKNRSAPTRRHRNDYVKIPPGHSGLLMGLTQKQLLYWIDPDYQGGNWQFPYP